MMQKITRIIPFALFALLLLSACGKFKEPEFRGISNLSIGQLNLKDPLLNLQLAYHNPNRSGLKIKHAEGDAWADGEFIGHFTMDTLVMINGESDFVLPVKFKPDLKPLLKTSLLSALGRDAQLKIEGKARVGKGLIFINYPIRYEGMHNLGELYR